MTAPLELVVLLHLHLPTGSTPEASEQAWANCFQPLLGALHHTPDVRVGMLLGGELIPELQDRHPEGIEWIRGLLERGSLELLGTALYEPVISGIPERDAVGQITAHATLIRKVFGVRPTGCWLPHGLWEPTVPRLLAEAGMAWAVVPDRHLEAAGEPAGEVSGVYRTEREGHCISLLPVDSRAQEMSGDVPVKDVLAHLRGRANRGHKLVSLALYSARFGLHPSATAKRDQTWFATLLAAVARASRSVDTLLPSHAVALGADRGRTYLPTLAGAGIEVPWERCLVRYDAANRLHKKMMRVSVLIQKMQRHLKDESSGLLPDPNQVLQAQRYLFRSQTSLPYWHGPHAGVYDVALRTEAWRDVLRAERLALEELKAADRTIVERADLDCDGAEEILLRTPDAAVVVAPSNDAAVTEFSVVNSARNLSDVLTRIREPYHAALLAAGTVPGSALPSLGEGERPSEPVVVDERPRALFATRLLGPEDTCETLRQGLATEMGLGFSEGRWEVIAAERHGTDAVRAVLQRDGLVRDGDSARRVRIHKRYTLRQLSLGFRQEVVNRDRSPLAARVALEMCFCLGPSADEQAIVVRDERFAARSAGDRGEIEAVRLEGDGLAVEIALLHSARLWHYPVVSVHRHLGAWRTGLLGICIVLVQEATLQPSKKSRFDLKLRVEQSS